MKNFSFTGYSTITATALIFSCSSSAKEDISPRPNILLMIADDLGYGDVTCFRGDAPWIPYVMPGEEITPPLTPHLDRLAESGMMLTSFYTNCSVCSPTRAALLTGRYNHRTGVINVLGQLGSTIQQVALPGEAPFTGLPHDEITLPQILRDGGYRTAAIGKWHLGAFVNGHHPMDYGFDMFVGTQGGAGNNFSLKTPDGRSIFYRNREAVEAPGYWYTDVLADEAIDFMTRSEEPFFTYLAFTAPHVPLFGPNDRELANAWDQKGTTGPREDLYVAYVEVVEGMDAAIGRIMEALQASGLDSNTLVIFASDNGPVDYGSPAPLRGRKTQLYEGGPRVPFIASWPGYIPENSRSAEQVMTMDLMPTLVRLAGGSLPDDRKIDGIDLTPVLLHQQKTEPRMLFWEKPVGVQMRAFNNRRWAVLDGNWKLQQERSGKAPELYNLETDLTESVDLAREHPEIVLRLTSAFNEWKRDVYADCPYDIDELTRRLKEHGIID